MKKARKQLKRSRKIQETKERIRQSDKLIEALEQRVVYHGEQFEKAMCEMWLDSEAGQRQEIEKILARERRRTCERDYDAI